MPSHRADGMFHQLVVYQGEVDGVLAHDLVAEEAVHVVELEAEGAQEVAATSPPRPPLTLRMAGPMECGSGACGARAWQSAGGRARVRRGSSFAWRSGYDFNRRLRTREAEIVCNDHRTRQVRSIR